jgi:hypothetical protein
LPDRFRMLSTRCFAPDFLRLTFHQTFSPDLFT